MLKKIKNKIYTLMGIVLLSNGVYAADPSAFNASNASASCDSTCMAVFNKTSQDSQIQKQLVACDAGFSGKKLQERIKEEDGSWSAWKDVSNTCTCVNTSKTQTVACTSPLKGTKTEKSNWVCSNSTTGTWSAWTTESSNCYTPCAPLPSQSQVISCPVNYVGSRTQTRNSTCSADDKLPPTWSAWTITSNSCVYSPPPPPPVCSATETGISHSCQGVIWGAVQYGSSTGKWCSGINGETGTEYINQGSCGGGSSVFYEERTYRCTCN